MNDIISIIIPVYNVEKYLRECLDSVINQTYKKLQIIIVDDGSTDNSGKICDEYAERDDRITVIHQKNQGAGAAKNAGLKLIIGNYFALIDSDDYIELNMYEKMIEYILNYNVDVVQCKYKKIYVDSVSSGNFSISKDTARKLSSEKYLLEILNDWRYSIFWNKLFKSNLLESNIQFPVGRKIDDEFFTYKLISRADYVLNVNDAFYNYRMRSSSVMNSNNNDRLINDRLDCFIERYNFIVQNRPSLKKAYYAHLSELLLFYRNQVVDENITNKINSLIENYPYKKPAIYKRLLRKIYGPRNTADIVKVQENHILFD